MTLRRYIPVKDELEDAGLRMVCFDDGAWVRAADVDALLARIREAVEVERDATLRHVLSRAKDRAPAFLAAVRPGRCMPALLSGSETVHQCPPDGSGIMPCCGRTPFEVLADRMADDPKLVTCRGRAG